jgi:hypothetical protein
LAENAPKVPNANKISIDKNLLERLLQSLTSKVDQLGQLGDDWGQACEEMSQTLAISEDKSKTLKKKVEVLTVQHKKVKRR